MDSHKRHRYVVVDSDDELLFNSEAQDPFFFSKSAICEAIEDDLDEPEAEDLDTGEIVNKRTDGLSHLSYHVFREVK